MRLFQQHPMLCVSAAAWAGLALMALWHFVKLIF